MIFKYGITIISIGILSSAYYVVGYKQHLQSISNKNIILAQQQKTINEYNLYKSACEQLSESTNILPSTPQEKSLLNGYTTLDIASYVEQAGLDEVFVIERHYKEKKWYTSTILDIHCTGTLDQVIEFFDKIKSDKYTIRYKRIDISQRQGSWLVLDCTFVLYAPVNHNRLIHNQYRAIIPKLCGIAGNPQRRCALVACSTGKKIVNVGDIVGQFEIVAIDKDTIKIKRQQSNEELVLKVE